MRSLLANWAFVQSIMSIDDPDRLMLDYTRQMMGFLLFNPSPQTIEMIGLGGGSLAKYCYKYLPDVSITAVEIDRSEEHTSELQSLMRISYDVFCFQKKKRPQ